MKLICTWNLVLGLMLAGVAPGSAAISRVIFEVTSPYHHIRVLEDGHLRTLCFDDALETQMSVQDPLTGHFEYTEYFHLAWLWNTNLSRVLMIGLGGASAQRSFEHYYPQLNVESVEIDPTVLQVAKDYFNLKESDRQQVHLADGRVYLRRSTARYDLVVLDAYVQGRYGSCLPQHLATKEFFELVRDHLTTNGIIAYNVIGSLGGWHAEIVGAIYRTLNTVFPQVYIFPCKTSQNIVLLATKARGRAEINGLRQRANWLVQTGRASLPTFRERLESLQAGAPANVARCPILTDDFAPVEGLAGSGDESDAPRSRAGRRDETSSGASRPGPQQDAFALERSRMVTEQLVAAGRAITNAQVLQAMERVPRHEFVPAQYRAQAYQDSALPIGYGQTISQPFIVAFMTEQLEPKRTDRVLEIGTGSGYQAAVLAELAGQVYTIEIVQELARRASDTLTRLGVTNVHARVGDGYKGWPEAAPFDGIIVTCAPDKVPQALADQLKEGGRMVVPVGTGLNQQLVVFTKNQGKLDGRTLLPVAFVPMTRPAALR